MSHNSEKKLVLVAAWGFVLAGLVLLSQKTLRADDSNKTVCPAGQCQVRVEVRGKIPLLEKIPLVKYFINSAGEQPCCEVTKDNLERIGVDFDLLPGHMVAYLPNGERQVICTEDSCPACEAPNACTASKTLVLSKKNCPDQCAGGKEVEAVVANHEAKLTLECAELEQVCHAGHQHPTCEQLIELRAENAALHAAREAQESILEARNELFEQLMELSMENARLAAQLDFLKQREEMREEMLSLVAENGKLKAEVELAHERHTTLKQSLQVTMENERLKLRIAELEQRDPASPKVARTAKKPRAAKKSSELK